MPAISIKNLRSSLLILGFSTMIIQIIMIRQVMAFFEGNELVIGLTLGFWMLLNGLGARMAGRWQSISGLHLLLVLLSLLSVLLIPFGRYLLVTPGVMAGLDTTALVILISLLPFCLVSGMLFPILSESYSNNAEKRALHQAYAMESAGSLLGGLLFSIAMVYLLNTWQCLTVVMIINLVAVILIYLDDGKRPQAFFLTGIILALIVVSIALDPLSMLDRFYFKGQEIISQRDTPYGRLVVTRLHDQVSIYQNGIPLTQSNDVASREERVHYAMLIKPEAEHVLMISGGTGGALDEALKYPLAQVDYVEVDPYLIEEVNKYDTLTQNPRINIIQEDPRRFIRNTRQVYEVVLVNAPDPSSGLLNRMYTLSFFQELKEHLASDGILQVALSGGANYMSNEALLMHSITYNSLKEVFGIVGLVPGGRNFFLAGDSLPNKMLGEMYAEAGIENQYVNPYYLNELQLGQRSRKIMEQLDPEAGINSDIKPLGYYLRIQEWLKQFQVPAWIIPSVVALVVIVFFFTMGALNLGLFAGGLSAASAEFMLLMWLQVTYGYVYQMTGLVFTMFMAGLALGSWILPNQIKQFTYRTFLLFQLLMSAFLVVLTGYIFLSENVSLAGWVNLALIFILTLLVGAITGLQYTSAIRLRKVGALKNVSLSYSADLTGSAIGAMIVSVFLLPLLGMYITGIGLAMFCLIVLGILFFKGSER